jgi:hypothetical protein
MSSCPIGAALGGDRYATPALSRCAWIQDFITTWRKLPGAGPGSIYTTRHRNTGSSNPQDTCSVDRTDGMPKPAADVIQGLV